MEALFLSIEKRDIQSVKELLQQNLRLLESNNGQYNAFSWAAIHSNDILKLLFELFNASDLKTQLWTPPYELYNSMGYKLVHVLTSMNNKKGLEIAIEYGVDVNSKDYNGDTALNIAMVYSSIDIIKLLLASGANPHLDNFYDISPLQRSIALRRKDLFKLLLKTSAGLNLSPNVKQFVYAIKDPDFESILNRHLRQQRNKSKSKKAQAQRLRRMKKKDLYNIFICENIDNNASLETVRHIATSMGIPVSREATKSELCQNISRKMLLHRKMFGKD
jgi:ankyrin repeat protein